MKINRRSVLRNLKEFLTPFKLPVVALFITAGLAVPVSLISPKMFQILLDDVLYAGQAEKLIYVILGLLFVYICRLILDSLNLYYGNKLLNGFTYKLRVSLWKKISGTYFSNIEKRNTGDLKMRIVDDVDSVGSFIKDQVVDYIFNIVLFCVCLYIIAKQNLNMTLICIWIIPIMFLINYLIAKGSKKVNEEIRKVNQEYYTSTYNSLQLWREIKIQCAEEKFIDKFRAFRDRLAILGFKSIRYWFYTEVFNDFKANYLSKVFIYIIGAFYIIKGDETVGIVIMYAEYFEMMFNAVDTINTRNAALKSNAPYYARIFDTLKFPEENAERSDPLRFQNEIEINIPSFSYPKCEKIVLHDLKLRVRKGDFISLIGESGCGKTTLLKLILGLYVVPGAVKFDGNNIEDISKDDLYNNIGVVMQDSFLFNMTIRENLTICNENASEAELTEVCEKADIYSFIKNLPDGFDTVIGERGVKLSGGQKQRICIARALIKNPGIIIFDEATSSLDKQAEDIVFETINKIAKDTTVIVVTHKPSAILRAKKIVIMENGTIAEVGDKEAITETNEFYKAVLEGAGING